MLSILILTKNEAHDLPGALASVAFSDDIHIVDSQSTDGTIAIANAAGVHVHQRVFDNYPGQRNFGLKLPYKYPWVFILDADERATPALSFEMQRAVAIAPPEVSGYRLQRRDFLFGTWLKHTQLTPLYIRLVRPECSRYMRDVNEFLEVQGSIADLAEPLNHFPFSKGISSWIDRHNRYSNVEAQLIHQQSGLTNPSLLDALRHHDFHTRRLHQKAFFYKLPGRPFIKWFYLMILRRGILDGPAGWTYATLISFYEYLIVLKTKELRLNSSKSN